MRTRSLALLMALAAVVTLLSVGFSALGNGPVRHEVGGLVVAPADGAVVRIAHDDIPGFMPAMTMPFVLESEVAAAALKPGDRVQFTLRLSEEKTIVESLQVVGRDPVGLRRLTAGSAAGRSPRLRDGDRVAPFRLVDQTGTPVTEAILVGGVTVATFIFTRCPLPDYCPAMMTRLKQIHARATTDDTLRGRVRLLAITLDPTFDTPDILAQYGAAHRVALPAFRLVTGAPDEIDALTAAFAVVARPSTVGIDHTLATAVIGPDGTVTTVLRGNGWPLEEALSAIRESLAPEIRH